MWKIENKIERNMHCGGKLNQRSLSKEGRLRLNESTIKKERNQTVIREKQLKKQNSLNLIVK